MIKQKEAVFIAFTAGLEQGLEQGSNALFDHVAAAVQTGIANGEVAYDKDRADEKAVKSYSRSLTSNWFKKDERINGGTKYVPATRRGPQVKDDTLKKLNDSLKSLKVHQPGNMQLISQVETKIAERREQLQSAKAGAKVQGLDETLAALQEMGITVDE